MKYINKSMVLSINRLVASRVSRNHRVAARRKIAFFSVATGKKMANLRFGGLKL